MCTVTKILKEFEKLGYTINYAAFDNTYYLTKETLVLMISVDKKQYTKNYKTKSNYCCPITLKEHKLLNELFRLWEWL